MTWTLKVVDVECGVCGRTSTRLRTSLYGRGRRCGMDCDGFVAAPGYEGQAVRRWPIRLTPVGPRSGNFEERWPTVRAVLMAHGPQARAVLQGKANTTWQVEGMRPLKNVAFTDLLNRARDQSLIHILRLTGPNRNTPIWSLTPPHHPSLSPPHERMENPA